MLHIIGVDKRDVSRHDADCCAELVRLHMIYSCAMGSSGLELWNRTLKY
jgi:hypothetical protein